MVVFRVERYSLYYQIYIFSEWSLFQFSNQVVILLQSVKYKGLYLNFMYFVYNCLNCIFDYSSNGTNL